MRRHSKAPPLLQAAAISLSPEADTTSLTQSSGPRSPRTPPAVLTGTAAVLAPLMLSDARPQPTCPCSPRLSGDHTAGSRD